MLVVKRLKKIWKGVKKGQWYTFKNCKHVQATHTCKIRSWQYYNNYLRGWWQFFCIKLIQFATLFHTLKHGKPILDYESHKTKTIKFFESWRKHKNTLGKHGEVEYGPILHIMLCWRQLNLFLQQFNTFH